MSAARAARRAATVLLAVALLACSGDDGADERAAPTTTERSRAVAQDGERAVPGDPLTGTGEVDRSLLTFEELTSPQQPSTPVDDGAFAIPEEAAMPKHTVEGTLTLEGVATAGGFELISGCAPPATCGEHLPPFTVDLVQNGSHLVPLQQGLLITGDVQPAYRTYNLIVGPGRIWSEVSDAADGTAWSRASLPFALVERNQNCIHNGVLAFVTDGTSVPQVRYQVTAETCQPGKFDMWGQVAADYTAKVVPDAAEVREAHAAEVAARMPTKPITALAEDHPDADLDLDVFGGDISPDGMTAYGVVYDGVNYVGGPDTPNRACQTRHGTYAYCDQLRLPSYSTAKAAFAGLSLAVLADELGADVVEERLRDHIPEMRLSPSWLTSPATLDHAADMATGNYTDAGFEADESAPNTTFFLEGEPYLTKMQFALNHPHHPGEAGHTWTYHTHDTFLLVQAATEILRAERGPDTDLFELVAEKVYEPIGLSAGAMTTLRTDNLAEARSTPTGGRPLGGLGMFLTTDDIAKLATFFQANGAHEGDQLVDRDEMLAAMQRTTTDTGVLALSSDGDGAGDYTVAAGGARYSNGLWALPTTERVPGCALRTPYMSGYGGITVAMFPNGATYYYFSDNGEFSWAAVIAELDELAPMCAPTTTSLTSDAQTQRPGRPVTFTATVTAGERSWAPTGTIQLRDGAEPLGPPVPLDDAGTATLTTSSLTRGRHSITATYLPDLTANTGTAGSPAKTVLAAPCPVGATTCTVKTTEGVRVGDVIVMGAPGATHDAHVVTALTPTTVSWVGALQRVAHGAGEAVWVQNTAGGGFRTSTSNPLRQTIG